MLSFIHVGRIYLKIEVILNIILILTLGIVKVPISRAKYWRIIILRKSFFPFSKFKLACFFLNSNANVRKPDIEKKGGQSQYDFSILTGRMKVCTAALTAILTVQASAEHTPSPSLPPKEGCFLSNRHWVSIPSRLALNSVLSFLSLQPTSMQSPYMTPINFSSSQVLKYMCCQGQDHQADK